MDINLLTPRWLGIPKRYHAIPSGRKLFPGMLIPPTKWRLMRDKYGIRALIAGYVIPPREDGPGIAHKNSF